MLRPFAYLGNRNSIVFCNVILCGSISQERSHILTATTRQEPDHEQLILCFTDKQAPTNVYCPADIDQVIVGSGINVTWREPEFTDNVEVERITSTKKSGDYFTLGSTLVKYDAFDKSGNTVSCTFTVSLKGK